MNDVNETTVSSTWQQPLQQPKSIPDSADVVIIGGGIIGVSTAWFLAQQGVDVVVCEKGFIAGEQSGRNWGWVRIQGRDPREIPMVQESQRIWSSLEEDIGEDVGYALGNCIYTARSDKELAYFDEWMQHAKTYGIDTRLLDSKEILSMVPTSGVPWKGAMVTASDARAEPHKAAPAIARAAERSGATILTGCAVRGVETSGGEVSSVVTEHGTIRTSVVLCAAGAWTSVFCGSLDIALPQLRVRGTVARTAPADAVIDNTLFDDHIAVRRRQDGGYTVAHGLLLEHPVTLSSFRWFGKFFNALANEYKHLRLDIGQEFIDDWRMPKTWSLDAPSPFESVRVLNPKPTGRVLRGIKNNLGLVFPDLQDIPLVECWAGMIEATPDVIPVIDEAESLRGFYIATGFSGHGFGIGPGAGKAIAGMLTGNDSGIDLSEFRLKRFFDGSPIRPMAGI